MAAGALGIAVLGGGLFVAMDAHRRKLSSPDVMLQATAASYRPLPTPELDIGQSSSSSSAAPTPSIELPIQSTPMPLPPPVPQPNNVEPPPRSTDLGPLSESPVVMDAGVVQNNAQGKASSSANASFMGNLSLVIAKGTLIRAVLETPVDSTRQGMARAIVARDVLSFDGRNVLMPRGSRLVGEFLADTASGQSRVLITWTELIRPDGAVIQLTSPSGDTLGRGGVAGKVNNHFFDRFGGAILQSVLAIGVTSASRNNSNAVIIATPGLLGGVQGASQPADVKPSINVKAGETITVFVARQLDFSAVGAE